MFIRRVYKQNKSSSTKYECHQLVESVRTDKGVQQKLLLSLGCLPLSKEKWPSLVKRLQAIIQGQESFIEPEPEIEELAQKYAQEFIISTPLETNLSLMQCRLNLLISTRYKTIGFVALAASILGSTFLKSCIWTAV